MARLVKAFKRTIAPPTWISARERASTHTRSPLVSGRLMLAFTQSLSPPGEKLTTPVA